ncbi:hypothetical protein K435DRAFT_812450 [Dendrothele bispora CBS 962.96]|uniref:Uncharacterized protein n=1 Tax=Dendrothele bispora (strain CBS 962.96) TaxID=1314807 RepID=A0A4S8KP60_DENBC|nr:hypothetical protein K435DRAFT_812450 [Dendrothele bispora CBS 962.96]
MSDIVTLVLDDNGFFGHANENWTVIEFYGFTPPKDANQSFLVTVNGSSVLSFPETYPEPNIGDLFYTSIPVEDSVDGQIDLSTNGPLLYFDYAVVTVTELEQLEGQTIILDDSNTEIQWVGSWEERRNYTLYGEANFVSPNGTVLHPAARPHENTTHESNEVGDFLIFQFQGIIDVVLGTSILVAGIAPMNRTTQALTSGPVADPPSSDFHLKLNFTLDGYSQSAIFINGGFPQPGGSPHFPYFQNSSLSQDNHTLIMTVDDVTGNTSVIIDYFTYKPSFVTLKDKPTFPPIVVSNNSTPAPTPTPAPTSSPAPNTGVIAGSVIGGVVFLVLLALGVWFLYKKKQQTNRVYRRESTSAPPTQAMSNLAVEPFVLPNPTESSSRKGAPSTRQTQSPSSSTTPWTSRRQQQGPIEPDNSFPLISPTATSSAEQHAELRRQRDELEETVHNLESQRGDVRTSDQIFATQDQIREMQSRVDMLTREMSRYMVPPAYDSR